MVQFISDSQCIYADYRLSRYIDVIYKTKTAV